MEVLVQFLKKLGYLFYIMDPREHMYRNIESVPDYYKEVTPVFIFVIALEQFVHLCRKRSLCRFNDSITNICQGMLVEIFKIPVKGTELLLYTWIYSHCRLIELPWNSVYTWLFCLTVTDFCFYWMHRATHQISFLWTFHEPHHTSEEFNMTIPLRLSVFTSATLWLTYLPMALAVPPSIFLVHYQMNIIYQYWLHSEFIPPLWILELLFVTPTHHRIHHGRNRRCIDKNFGGFLIIWDKLFGTFEVHESPEDIVYGLVHPLKTFNPFMIQTNNLRNMWTRFVQVRGVRNKTSVLLKGPGWTPGAPWLGHVADIPQVIEDKRKYDPPLPLWLRAYSSAHILFLVSGYLLYILNLEVLPFGPSVLTATFIIYSAIAFGAIFDQSSFVPMLEVLRCLLYCAVDAATADEVASINKSTLVMFLLYRWLFSLTLIFWIGRWLLRPEANKALD